MNGGIAIIGAACRYPDATSPRELWQNALAGRRAFRALPESRLRLADYAPRGGDDPDSTYLRYAALIEGFEIDREHFKVSGRTFRSTDHAHWLALDVAYRALEDAGFPAGRGLPRVTTGVLVGNSLTGDSSRASALRLRWPYVRRIVTPALLEHGLGEEAVAELVAEIEQRFKQPLPAFDEDTLAGGLSNTIGGRICNVLDLGGGGYTVDGACSSSLLAIANACTALTAGDLDLAIAGGVDVSIDPFELVGFARLGALATDDMRVYDRRPTGFLPGEGAGFVVLMRLAEAEAQGKQIHAVIRGWGIASDGHGGITRPQASGHQVALQRCYARTGWSIDSIALFEGHGTGTAVGDEVELAAIAGALRSSGVCGTAAIGSIKTQIGHTKAAAGVAGLLKVVSAVREQVIPPLLGLHEPHPELSRPDAVLRAPISAEAWPAHKPLRAGVSAVGFGGINVHVAVEAIEPSSRRALTTSTKRLDASRQDVELLVLSAHDLGTLAERAVKLGRRVAASSWCELTDVAAAVARARVDGKVRCAVVGATPDRLGDALQRVAGAAERGDCLVDPENGIYVTETVRAPRIALLFTGQGAPVPVDCGALGRRFEPARRVWKLAGVPADGDLLDTRNAQPRIVSASLAAVTVLESLGVYADVAVGHSLGELTALSWAGAWTAEQVVDLARARGLAMAKASGEPGAMLALACDERTAEGLIAGTGLVIAAYNGPANLVVSGPRADIDLVNDRARARGIAAAILATSHAFHSPLMSGACDALASALAAVGTGAPTRPIVSTVTGTDARGVRPAQLLLAQLVGPVRFTDAMRNLGQVDLVIECGPGSVFAGLARSLTTAPVVAVDACGPSLRGMVNAIAAAWALGARVDIEALFADRYCKPVLLETPLKFLGSPCEGASVPALRDLRLPDVVPDEGPSDEVSARSHDDVLSVVRRSLADVTELPLSSIADNARVLEDLHLSSITVAKVVATVARVLGVVSPRPLAGWARATVEQIADAFEDASRASSSGDHYPAGAADWTCAFEVTDDPCPPPSTVPRTGGTWTWYGPDDAERGRLDAILVNTGGGSALVVREATMESLLLLARAPGPIVVFDPERVASGFCRSLQLETGQPVLVLSCASLDDASASAIRREIACLAPGFREVQIARDGTLTTPVLSAIDLAAPEDLGVSAGDVVLVTGGGKGIGAECALELGARTGCTIITLGRSSPDSDAAVAANRERFRIRGVRVHHCEADLTDPATLSSSLQAIVAVTGPITMLVHAAGVNEPHSVLELTVGELRRTCMVKHVALANLLEAFDRTRLRKIVAFGSIIARSGLPGEAHYALANDALRRAMQALQASLPGCSCITLEWSAWAEVGMAERLGRMDALLARGLRPISIARGVAYFLRAIADGRSCAITSRLGDAGIVKFRQKQLPLSRFLERVLVHVPEVELVCEVELAPSADLYADDHVLEAARVFPAVMQIEAACQAAAALAGTHARWRATDVRFSQAILIPESGCRLRIAICRDDRGDLAALLTCSTDAYKGECMRARFEPLPSTPAAPRSSSTRGPASIAAPYETLFPQRGRFVRITGYRQLSTTSCSFDVSTRAELPWFARHFSQDLVLADPGSRDALLHGIQLAVPHERLVPTGAATIELASSWPDGQLVVDAYEVASSGGEFVWNIIVSDLHGTEVERWSEARFRSIGRRSGLPQLALMPWFERHAISVASDARVRAGDPDEVHRPDGRPEARGCGTHVSATRGAGFRLVVENSAEIACDVERVVPREHVDWHGVLGASMELAALISQTLREPFDRAATRVWTALECCAKLGQPEARLLLAATDRDSATLSDGDLRVSTFANTFDAIEVVGALGTRTHGSPTREAAS